MVISMRWNNWKKPNLVHNKLTRWNWMVQNPENLSLEPGCDIGAFTYINAKNGVTIAKDVQIGSHCAIYSISTIDGKEGEVIIQEGACIGSHTTVMPGITIGKNATIGAHSFVNKDIPENSVAFGVPAKIKTESER
jgi:serine acetyltransferase